MEKPKIFISSTIYDFKDLRSALKYWLEEMGYNVQLSEFNDFEKDLNQNSYNACLKNIETCDYFILLVGGRVGGFYDYENKISITQKEYRYAYNLAKNNKIKLIIFVREEIWDIKNDRTALKNYLKENYIKTKELGERDLEKISSHSSSFINDANFIFDFLDEVGRKEEMIEATKNNKEFPERNWIHQFNIFKDIIEVLKTELNINNNLEYIIHTKNIKREIGNNLTEMITKNGKHIMPLFGWAEDARKQLGESYNGISSINGNYLKRLSIFEIIGIGISNSLSTTFMENAISSGVFFYYDNNDKVLKPSKLQNTLIKLVEEIKHLKLMEKNYSESPTKFKITKKFGKCNTTDKKRVNNSDLVYLMGIHDSQYNIFLLSKYILDLLDKEKNEVSFPKLFKSSPFDEEAEKLKKEKVSIDEAMELIKSF